MSTAFLNARLTELHHVEAERLLRHDELYDLVMSPTAHDLVVDVRDHVVDAQTGRVRWSVLVGLYDQVLDRVDIRVVEEDLDSADCEAEAARTFANHHLGTAQALVHYFHELFGLVDLIRRIRTVHHAAAAAATRLLTTTTTAAIS